MRDCCPAITPERPKPGPSSRTRSACPRRCSRVEALELQLEGRIAALAIGDDGDALWALAQDVGADMIVAGAYGHSRRRERVLGGVTKNLFSSKDRYSLVPH